MADTKISALPAASTPLAGTEILPIVQSSTTKKVAVSDLTAGRAVSALSLTLTGSPLAATSGGTGASSSFTSGGVAYASSTSALSTGSNLYSNGSDAALGGTPVTDGPPGMPTFAFLSATSGRSGEAYWADTGANNVATAYFYGSVFYVGTNTAHSVQIRTNSTTRLTIASGGDTTFNTGNIIQGTAAKGVNFTANTPAAGMTSQLLNWYETGTFTPTFVPNAGAGFTSVTYNSVTGGRYTRIGNIVHIQCVVRTDAITVGSATGALCIGGLPFTAVANTTGRDGFSTFVAAQVSGWTGVRPLSGSVSASESKIILWGRSSVSGDTAATDVTDLGTGAAANYIELSGSYICA